MIELPRIDNETARELRDLYYPQDSYHHYQSIGILPEWNESFVVPLQAEVCKWLRDEYKIFISVVFELEVYEVYIDEGYNIGSEGLGKDFEVYEQAELAGIKKAIEILKERQNDNTTS